MTLETHNTNHDITKPRRWFRFRLRTLLVMVTLLSIPLGWVGWELEQRRREKATIDWVGEMGGRVDQRLIFSSNVHTIQFSQWEELGTLVYFPSYSRTRSWWEMKSDKWFGKRVQFVNLDVTSVRELSPLADLKNLKKLNLTDTRVTDLSPLSELNKLKFLDLRYTNVSDVSPLAELKCLETLYLDSTQVNDLSPLAELNNLVFLDLCNTQVSDLSPLVKLKKLSYLGLSNTHVSDEQVEELGLELPKCAIVISNKVDQPNPQH